MLPRRDLVSEGFFSIILFLRSVRIDVLPRPDLSLRSSSATVFPGGLGEFEVDLRLCLLS